MGKDIPNFINFVESYIIKYNNISPSGVIPPDLLISNSEEIQKGAAVVRALDHLVHVKALGSKEGNHGIGLGSDGSALSNGVLGTLGYIRALVFEVGAKGGLVNKEEFAIFEPFRSWKHSEYFP